ncbi:hypothetical protein ANABIO32_31420 [Rossellomorea marisflavi]|nr:hypothetical protein ANABIO32_31420 [Rossellomorea marisflavi]
MPDVRTRYVIEGRKGLKNQENHLIDSIIVNAYYLMTTLLIFIG